jgi:hypothetical protein
VPNISEIIDSAGSTKRGTVNQTNLELARRLFAVATMVASRAEEAAIAGQSDKLETGHYKKLARKLIKQSDDLMSTAKAILAVADLT